MQELEALAEELAIELRYEDIEGRGGLCRYGGRTRLIASRHLSLSERIHLLSTELARCPLEEVFLHPHIRELLEGVQRGSRVHKSP